MEQSEAARLNVECLGEGRDEARQGSQCLDKRTQDMRISLPVVNWYNAPHQDTQPGPLMALPD